MTAAHGRRRSPPTLLPVSGAGHMGVPGAVPWGHAPCSAPRCLCGQLPRAVLGMVTPHGCHAAPTLALPAASRGQNPAPGACGRAQGVPSAAPRALPSAPAGDAKPEVIVKVEPEEEAYIGCPQGPGDPGGAGAGEHCGAGTRLVSASGGCVWVRSCCWESPRQGLEQLGRQRAWGCCCPPSAPTWQKSTGRDPGPVLLPALGALLLVRPWRSTELLSVLSGQPQLSVCFTGGG